MPKYSAVSSVRKKIHTLSAASSKRFMFISLIAENERVGVALRIDFVNMESIFYFRIVVCHPIFQNFWFAVLRKNLATSHEPHINAEWSEEGVFSELNFRRVLTLRFQSVLEIKCVV